MKLKEIERIMATTNEFLNHKVQESMFELGDYKETDDEFISHLVSNKERIIKILFSRL